MARHGRGAVVPEGVRAAGARGDLEREEQALARVKGWLLAGHCAVSALLLGAWWGAGAALLGWGMAWVAQGEPSPPSGYKHRDAAAFMATRLGQALARRRGWVPSQGGRWALVAVGVIGCGAGAAIGWASLSGRAGPQAAQHVLAWAWITPPLLIAAAWIIELTLLTPAVFFAAAGLSALFGVAMVASGAYAAAAKLALWAWCAPAAMLWTLDLLRLWRRAQAQPQGSSLKP